MRMSALISPSPSVSEGSRDSASAVSMACKERYRGSILILNSLIMIMIKIGFLITI